MAYTYKPFSFSQFGAGSINPQLNPSVKGPLVYQNGVFGTNVATNNSDPGISTSRQGSYFQPLGTNPTVDYTKFKGLPTNAGALGTTSPIPSQPNNQYGGNFRGPMAAIAPNGGFAGATDADYQQAASGLAYNQLSPMAQQIRSGAPGLSKPSTTNLSLGAVNPTVGASALNGGVSTNDLLSQINNNFSAYQDRINPAAMSVLDMINGQINNPASDQYLNAFNTSQGEYGIQGYQDQLAKLQDLYAQRANQYNLGSNYIANQPIPQQLLIGQGAALERQRQAELSNLGTQEGFLQDRLKTNIGLAGQQYGARSNDIQFAIDNPQRLVGLLTSVYGIPQAEAQARVAQYQAQAQAQQLALGPAYQSDLGKEYLLAKQNGFAGSPIDYVKAITSAKTDPTQNMTSGIKEYQFAKSQGYQGSFVDWLTQSGGKPPTAEQLKIAGFATRAENSTGIIDNLGPSFTGLESYLGQIVPNILKGEDRQMFEQASRDFVNAVLRRESGAAINDAEFQNAYKQYIPQPGDSEGVLQQKAYDRMLVIQNLYQSAGGASQGGTTSGGGNVDMTAFSW